MKAAIILPVNTEASQKSIQSFVPRKTFGDIMNYCSLFRIFRVYLNNPRYRMYRFDLLCVLWASFPLKNGKYGRLDLSSVREKCNIASNVKQIEVPHDNEVLLSVRKEVTPLLGKYNISTPEGQTL